MPGFCSLGCSRFIHAHPGNWRARAKQTYPIFAGALPFADGGKHACLLTDIYLRSRKHPIPKWPQFDAMEHGDKMREQYIFAMIRADEDYYEELMKFIEQLL